jgi:hypothetical protein
MNIKRQFLLILSILPPFVAYHPTLSGGTGAAIEAGVWDLRDQGLDPDSLILLKEYNNSNYNVRDIDNTRISQFLDDQLTKNKLDPQLFRYFVGIEQNWQIVKIANDYALIIPDLTSTTSSLISSLWNRTNERTALYSLNIQDLNQTLKTNNQKRIPAYKLAIVKAIVAAESKGIFQGLSSAIAQATFAFLGQAAKNIEPNLQYIFTALANVYPLITGNKQWINYQKNLDNYILNSLDMELIQAHIKDLEEQLLQEKGSITTKLWGYIPSSSPKAKSALEERIEIMQNFVNDNELELKLMQSIRNKKKVS